MAIVPFSAAPYNKPIRWDGCWWKRTNYWHMVSLFNSNDGIQIMQPDALIAIFRKDLEKSQMGSIREEILV